MSFTISKKKMYSGKDKKLNETTYLFSTTKYLKLVLSTTLGKKSILLPLYL